MTAVCGESFSPGGRTDVSRIAVCMGETVGRERVMTGMEGIRRDHFKDGERGSRHGVDQSSRRR